MWGGDIQFLVLSIERRKNTPKQTNKQSNKQTQNPKTFLVSFLWKLCRPLIVVRWRTFQCQVQLELDGTFPCSLHRWRTYEAGIAPAFAVSLRKEAPHVRLSAQAGVGVNSFSNNPQRGLPPAVKVLGFLTVKQQSISGALCLDARATVEFFLIREVSLKIGV